MSVAQLEPSSPSPHASRPNLGSTGLASPSLASPFPVFSRAPRAQPTPSATPTGRPSVELASSRAFASNPNHHLWKNGRLWWIAFTLIHDGWRQERIRQSLGTDNQLEARRRRDAILSLFATGGVSAGVNGCVDPEPEAVRN
jgi:hypothetical protein